MRRLSLLPSAPYYPTASELRIAGECVAPWALGLPESDETNEWAEQGKRLHGVAEGIANGDMMFNDDCSEAVWRHLVDALDNDKEMAKRRVPERFDAWHVEQGIKWRTDGFDDEAEFCERAPGERLRGWFAGTTDLAYVRHDGLLLIADWKFGPREHINGEPAKESCQGFFLATAFAAKLGIRGSGPSVVVARFERRMVSEDEIEVDGYDITQGELDAFAEQLRGLAARIDKAEGAMPKISAACGKCKAKMECPAWEALESHAMAVICDATSDRIDPFLRPPQSPEDVRLLHHAVTAGKAIVDEWEEWAKAYVLTHPEGVLIGLGMKLKGVPTKDREVVDTSEGLDAIERIIPGGVVFERKAGIGTIEKAISVLVDKANISSSSDKKKTKKAETERVFAELTAVGAVIDKGKKLAVRVVRSDEKEW